MRPQSVLACAIDARRNTWRYEMSESIGSAKRDGGVTIPNERQPRRVEDGVRTMQSVLVRRKSE